MRDFISPFHVTLEMNRLRRELDARNIEWEDVSSSLSECWICRTHFDYNGSKWSVIHGYGTYGGYDLLTGRDDELLECMVGGNEPIGYLKASDIIQMIDEEA